MKDSKSGNFATKLQSLLSNASHGAIIGWADNKTAIEVVDQQRMEAQILPLYFRQTKFESFVRQLNLYGFRKVKAQQSLKFTHPSLQQGLDLSKISTVKVAKSRSEVNEDRQQAEAPSRVIIPVEISNNEMAQDGVICDTLGQNRSTDQIQNSPSIKEETHNPPFCFPPVVYYTINPYLIWNFPLFNTPSPDGHDFLQAQPAIKASSPL